ncbi:MAG: hypothetical protein ISQ52_08040 [Synechococcus sp. BS307-5m-G38]|nr:hypothetical protein [Synechococcus sp. BS307-5m-G38]
MSDHVKKQTKQMSDLDIPYKSNPLTLQKHRRNKGSHSVVKAVIKTKTLKDDRKLANEIAKPIFKNLKSAIRKIENYVDEIAVLGAPPVVESPEAQDWITDFSNKYQSRASNFLSLASSKLQRKLEKNMTQISK